ncbi:MAG: sugar transferase [Actinophytocola sp.]|uniref:sugar transferase n=1 Tax=Actinophytocola sp. TaxID=1872138 RepID=UPI003C7575AB
MTWDPPWHQRYQLCLLWTDTLLVLWAVTAVHVLAPNANHPPATTAGAVVAWWLALALSGSRDPRVLGAGYEEYRRILAATAVLAATTVCADYLVRTDLARDYVLVALPIGVVALMLARLTWRRWLRNLRSRGSWTDRVLVAGSQPRVDVFAGQLAALPHTGYRLVGTCLMSDVDSPPIDRARRVLRLARRESATMIAVTTCDAADTETLRRLGWLLEGTGIQLVIAPVLAPVSVPRVRVRTLAGLALLNIDGPALTGVRQLAKRSFDVVVAATALVVLSPALLAIAALVRCDSPGPALYRQWRIGQHGEPFRAWKFRSMTVDAEDRHAELLSYNESSGPLFKMHADPRVTRVGRILRRHSLDELPQLANVLSGRMSLVGPRPPLPTEVAMYAKDTRRRLLVRPGITGPWQVGGRSDLAWDAGIALDLSYVENWTFATDLEILWKTVRVVVRGAGAY